MKLLIIVKEGFWKMCKIDPASIFRQNVKSTIYGQIGVEYYTGDEREATLLEKRGWKKSPYHDKYRVVPPRRTVIDIIDYNNIADAANIYDNFLLFESMNKLRKNRTLTHLINQLIFNDSFFCDFEYMLVESQYLDFEICIIGSDYRIDNLLHLVIEFFKNHNDYPNNHELIIPYATSSLKRILDSEVANKLTDFVASIDCDIIVVIANGAYKFIDKYFVGHTLSKVVVCEYHAWEKTKVGPDCFGWSSKYINKIVNSRRVLIIDYVYSGITINCVKEYIECLGGEVITLGLFPKSLEVIKKVENVLILNQIYSSDSIPYEMGRFFQFYNHVMLKWGYKYEKKKDI